MNAARLHWALWSRSLRDVSTLQRRWALETAVIEMQFLLGERPRAAPKAGALRARAPARVARGGAGPGTP